MELDDDGTQPREACEVCGLPRFCVDTDPGSLEDEHITMSRANRLVGKTIYPDAAEGLEKFLR